MDVEYSRNKKPEPCSVTGLYEGSLFNIKNETARG
jgi:hypothetical protein